MNGSSKVLSSVLLSGVLLVAGFTNPVEVNSKQTTAADNHSNITMVAATIKYKVTINGKPVSLHNSSIRIGPNHILPAKSFIIRLGGTTTFNSKTKVLTIKSNGTTSTIKQGSKVATVNGKKITLSTSAQAINDVFMIPHDLVAKATDTKVSISTSAKTIDITQATPISPSRIKTKYQGHTYGSDNQYQYDKTMAYVNNYFKNYKSTFDFGYTDYYGEAYDDYFKKGVKVPPEWSNRDYYYKGLDFADRWGRDLRKNKVSYSQIVKLAEVESKARDFLNDQPMLRWDDAYDVYSAYHFFYKRKGDSDSYAHAQQIVFDMNGYKTRILSIPPSSWLEVQINGKWYIHYDDLIFESWRLSTSWGVQ
ncbi:copper amine oxidase N-terminal domain-containing protein [Viridibacillus arvi]|uniref:copper amine oxidase N-terminal domain-containing protein n=1 Tax=Viridibacillus arvi TaxID=263475 RepID=UPI003D08451B